MARDDDTGWASDRRPRGPGGWMTTGRPDDFDEGQTGPPTGTRIR